LKWDGDSWEPATDATGAGGSDYSDSLSIAAGRYDFDFWFVSGELDTTNLVGARWATYIQRWDDGIFGGYIDWAELASGAQDSSRLGNVNIVKHGNRISGSNLVVDTLADTLTNKSIDMDDNTVTDIDSTNISANAVGYGDLTEENASADDVLTFDGTNWGPAAAAGGSGSVAYSAVNTGADTIIIPFQMMLWERYDPEAGAGIYLGSDFAHYYIDNDENDDGTFSYVFPRVPSISSYTTFELNFVHRRAGTGDSLALRFAISFVTPNNSEEPNWADGSWETERVDTLVLANALDVYMDTITFDYDDSLAPSATDVFMAIEIERDDANSGIGDWLNDHWQFTGWVEIY
jgi:hypothetical protein